jgi:hypothetical protein
MWDLWWTKWHGQIFSEYFGVLCQLSFHRLLHIHHHRLSSGAGTIAQLVADVPSGLSLTPPQETKNKCNEIFSGVHPRRYGVNGPAFQLSLHLIL